MNIVKITEPRNLITKEYMDSMGAGYGQLRVVTDGIESGFRLYGKNPIYYGGVGKESIDLSFSESIGRGGAKGDYSFISGYNIDTDNDYSAVLGAWNQNKPGTVFEIGNGSGRGANPRSNALEVYQDGQILAPSSIVGDIVESKALITKEYLDSVGLGYVTGPETDLLIADASITDYTVTSEPVDPNIIDVFVNGVLLKYTRDYNIISTNTTITFSFDTLYAIYEDDWLKIKIPSLGK